MNDNRLEDLNVCKLRFMVRNVERGVEALHFLIYSECGDDLVRWAADSVADDAAKMRKLCDTVIPEDD